MTERQEDIVRKILALRRVVERTEFFGQAEAAQAAIDRLAAKYRVDVETLRDEEKRGRIVNRGRGWRGDLAVHLGWYLGLEPTRLPSILAGGRRFGIMATDAEFDLWRDTLEFHIGLIAREEQRLKAVAAGFREEIRAAKKRLATHNRQKRAALHGYLVGYIGQVMPLPPRKGRKGRRLRGAAVDGWYAGRDAGRRVQIGAGRKALAETLNDER